MEQYSPEHLVALCATLAIALCSVFAARRRSVAWERRFALGLAGVLGANLVAYQLVRIAQGSWSLDFDLPLHLTDVVSIVAVMALIRPGALAFELTWFWGMTAALLAILTPDLGQRFPSFFYFNYFLSHSGVVVAAVFLTAGVGLTPRPRALWRALAATACVTAVAATANVLTGGNYMFLAERPSDPSPLDLMGPWPWYIAVAGLVALVMFALLDLPFRRRRAVRRPAVVPRARG